MNLITDVAADQPTAHNADSRYDHHQNHNNVNAQVNQNTADILTKVSKAGDTMTGPLVLPADPTQPLQAATKAYVDAHGGGGGGGSSAWGGITGTLSNQTDLQAALNAKLTAASNLSDLTSATVARANLGLASMALQGAGAVAITGGTITGITDLAVADGGTGASTAANARTNLGLVIGTDVEAAIVAGSTNQYWRGDKSWQDFNTQVRTNRLDQMAVPTANVSMNSQNLVSLAAPVNPADAATKAYVDAVASGLSVKAAVNEGTAAALPANTYNNGTGGVGATLTASANGALTVDGVTVAGGDRVLVKSEATAANNGIYVVTATGDSTHPYILTRSTDLNTGTQFPGAFGFIEAGTVNGGSGWVVLGTGPFTVGTTAVSFTQFSAGGDISAGNGLVKVGTVISVGPGPGILAISGQTAVDFTAVQAKNGTLDALSGLATTGFISRTGGGTATTRAIVVGSGRLTVTNGDGLAGNPSLDIGTLAESDVTGLVSDLALKSPLASPTFTGTPAAPTAAAGTNTTQLATTAFVEGEFGVTRTWTTPQIFNAGALFDKGNIVFDARAYGVVADAKMVTDSAMTSGSPIITSATAAFTPSDVGKGVLVTGAGDAGGNIAHMLTNVSIISYQSATQVTLSANATHTVSGATLWYGTDSHTFLGNALTAAAGKGYVQLPAGNVFLNSQGITIPANTGLQGMGRDISFLVGGGINCDLDYQWISDLTIDCDNHYFFDGINCKGQYKDFSNLHVKNWGNFGIDIRWDDVRSLVTKNVFVKDCILTHNGVNSVTGGSVILTGTYNNVHIDDCVFEDNTNGGCFLEIYTDGGHTADGSGFYFNNNRVTGKFSKAGYALGTNMHVTGNVFACDFEVTSAVDQDSVQGSYISSDVHIDDNTFIANANNGNRTALYIKPSGNSNAAHWTPFNSGDSGIVSQVWVTHNTFVYGQMELEINNPATGNFITGLHIDNNEFVEANAACINFITGYPITFDGLHITNNNFRKWGGAWDAINLNPNTATAVMTFIRSEITHNTFGPTGSNHAVSLKAQNGGTLAGTLYVYDNDLGTYGSADTSGTVMLSGHPLTDLSVVNTDGQRIDFTRSVNGVNGFNPLVWIDASSASESVGALVARVSNASASGTVAQFQQSGTGKGVVITNAGSANSLEVDAGKSMFGSTNSAQQIIHTYGTSGQGIRIESSGDQPTLELKGSSGTISLKGSNSGNWLDVTVPGGPTPTLRLSSSNFELHTNAATSGTTLQNSPLFQLYGEYWNGSASTDYKADITHIMQSTGPTSRLRFQINSSDLMNLTSAGLLGIGQINPTAYLDLPASTTSNATARIRSGAAPTTPNDGDLWNDSTTHHLMARLNGASYQLDGAVIGPASSTNQGIVRFNGTTGQLVQDSHGPIIDDNGRVILRNTNQDTVLLLNNVTGSGTQAPLANEILFQPNSAPGTFDTTYGYGVISWYNDDTTVKDVIMQAHHHLDSDATNDHHHFSLYTSNAARSSTIKRFNVQYREDYALMDFQNTYLTISNVGTNNALEIDLNNDDRPGDGLMVRSSTGSRTYHITKDAQQSFVGLFSSDSATRYAVTGDTTARALVKVDGSLQWGDGTNPADTWLYRSAVGVLSAGGPLFTGGAISVHLSTPFSPVAALAAGGTLTVGTGLFYVVTALDGAGGETTQSIEVQATPASGNQTINLTWGTVPGAASYNVYRSITTGVYTTPALIKNVAVTSYSDTGADSLVSGAPPGSSITPVTKLSFTGGNSWVNSGNFGIGLTAPTALLHLAAGHSGAGSAPLKLTSGVNLTTPEAGAFEWDGTNAYITQTTGPTRKTLAYIDSNITGSAAKWTTARNLAGNSVDGSADVAFANKFIVQGTADSGLSAAQFMGALGTGIVKNTTTTGVLSIAAAGTDYLAPAGNGSALTGITQSQVSGLTTGASPTFAGLNLGTGALNTVGNIEVDGSAARDLTVARSASTNGVNLTVQAGGGQSTGTDLSGGNLFLTSGIGTGAGGSNIQMSVVKTGQGAGPTDRSPAVAFVFGSTNSSGPYLTTTGATASIAGILLNGQNNQVVQVNSQATTNTAGQSLTVQGGSATTGATDKGGGDAIVSSGRSTGTGGSNVRIQTWTRATSTGTGFNTQTDRIIAQSPKSVTNNSATTVASMTNANGGVVAGRLSYTVEVTDGTDFQYETGVISYGVTNKGGTIANNTVTKFGNQQAATSGTLAVTWTITAANPALIQVNANSSLTPSTGYPRVTFVLENLTQQAVTIS